MLQALFLFDDKNKRSPKRIITDIHQIDNELKSTGVVCGIYPIDHIGSKENPDQTQKTSKSIKDIQQVYEFAHYDLSSIGPQSTDTYQEVKKRNGQLHWHDAPETRLFLSGGGSFGIFNSPWLGICLLNAGGFIQIPAKTYHWFDYGKIDSTRAPEYKVVRFWKNMQSVQASMRPHPATCVGSVVDWIQPFPTYDVLLTLLHTNCND